MIKHPCTVCDERHRFQFPDGSDQPGHEASLVACLNTLRPRLPDRCRWCGHYAHGDLRDPVTMRRCVVHLRADVDEREDA